ncbi:MAG: hypothetical protein ABEJ93_04560 [Candidatus Nanohalobium sp.]
MVDVNIASIFGALLTLAAFAVTAPLFIQTINSITPYTGQLTDLMLWIFIPMLVGSILVSAVSEDQNR